MAMLRQRSDDSHAWHGGWPSLVGREGKEGQGRLGVNSRKKSTQVKAEGSVNNGTQGNESKGIMFVVDVGQLQPLLLRVGSWSNQVTLEAVDP